MAEKRSYPLARLKLKCRSLAARACCRYYCTGVDLSAPSADIGQNAKWLPWVDMSASLRRLGCDEGKADATGALWRTA